MSAKALYWLLQSVGWGLVFLLNAGLGIVGGWRVPITPFLSTMGLCSLGGLLGTHLWQWEIRRRRLLDQPLSRMWPRYLAGVLFTGAAVTALAGVWYWLLLVPDTFRRTDWIPRAYTFWTVLVGIWTWTFVAAASMRRANAWEKDRLRAEVLAREARLEALRKQLNPHFLFNSLNSLRALIFEDARKASQVVDRLAALLRYSLQSDGNEMVTLAEELVMVNEYLSIEKIRFEERLTVETNISIEATQARVPRMLLQTLVENAVKHGVERRVAGGLVTIMAMTEGSCLHLVVRNPGALTGDSQSTRLGLKNAGERLMLLAGSGATLTLRQAEAEVEAEAVVPQ